MIDQKSKSQMTLLERSLPKGNEQKLITRLKLIKDSELIDLSFSLMILGGVYQNSLLNQAIQKGAVITAKIICNKLFE